MYRSFTDRVLAGVCGGLGIRLGVNAWIIRTIFVILTPLSSGTVALLYLMLWWAMPQQSLSDSRRRSSGTASAVLLTLIVGAAWIGQVMGWLKGTAGQEVYWPLMLLVLSAVFLLRQVRA